MTQYCTALSRGRPVQDFVEPSGEIELWLAGQWTELFGGGRYSATDDFLALGGDSITATRLASRIHRDFGVTVSLRCILSKATMKVIAEEIADQQFRSMDSGELLALLDEVETAVPVPSDELVWSYRRSHTECDSVW